MLKKLLTIVLFLFLLLGMQGRAFALSDNASKILSQILSCQLDISQASVYGRANNEKDFYAAAEFIDKEGVEVVRDNGKIIPRVQIFGLSAFKVHTVASFGVAMASGSFGQHALGAVISALKEQNIVLEKTTTPEMGEVYKMEKWAGEPNKSAVFQYLLFEGTIDFNQGMKFERSKNKELGYMCVTGGGPGSAN
jgi:hypothetical protein